MTPKIFAVTNIEVIAAEFISAPVGHRNSETLAEEFFWVVFAAEAAFAAYRRDRVVGSLEKFAKCVKAVVDYGIPR